MPKTRTLDKSVKTGALLAGIPFLVAGLMPYSTHPLLFAWNAAQASDSLKPLLPAAAGVLLVALGVLPGLPRLLRAIFLLGLSGAVAYFVAKDFADSQTARNMVGHLDFTDPPVLVFLGTFVLAATAEILMQGRKTSKILALLAFIGWAGFAAQTFFPWNGRRSLTLDTVKALPDLLNTHLGASTLAIAWPLITVLLSVLLAVFGAVFAFLRLVRSQEGMVSGPFKSGWAGVLLGGLFGIALLGALMFPPLDAGAIDGELVAVAMGMLFWGVGVGVTGGLAHTVLGFIPAPRGAEDMDRPVYQPEPRPAQLPQAQPQFPQAQPQFPQAQPQFPQAQPQFPQAQPQFGQQPQARPAQPQPQLPQAQPQFGQPQPQARPAQQPPQFGPAGGQMGGFGQPQGAQGGGWQQPAPAQAAWQQPAPAAPAAQPARNLPRGQSLQPYPGYPGYVVCPQCRGGIAVNFPKCSHCGQEVAW